jgi:hypothetical protein
LVPDFYQTNLEGDISLFMHATRPAFKWDLLKTVQVCLLPYEDYHIVINFYSTSIPPLMLIISSKRLCTQFILFII